MSQPTQIFDLPPARQPSSGNVHKLTLKRGNLFWVADPRGEIAPAFARDLGLFQDDTRYLSYYKTSLQGFSEELLSSASSIDGFLQVDISATPSLREAHGLESDRFLHVRRVQVVEREWADLIEITNYLGRHVDLVIEVSFANDFADLFEVRGLERPQRGRLLAPEVTEDGVILAYACTDGVVYRTRILFSPRPVQISAGHATLALSIGNGHSSSVEVKVEPLAENIGYSFGRSVYMIVSCARDDAQHFLATCPTIHCDNEFFQRSLSRALADIRDLYGVYNGHRVLTAGIPWYATPFGRDSLWTSLQLLPLNASIAEDTLRFLAAQQGKQIDPFREEEPGKILHELRIGEMARTRETPHSPYYGSIDATPLFLILLEETYRWTGNEEFLKELLPAAKAALAWIDSYGDLDGDGFVEYRRLSPQGLDNQGWKDSHDAIQTGLGEMAKAPIALVEVQGYVYDAKLRMSRLLRGLGDFAGAEALFLQAKQLRKRIEEAFWLEQLGTYALALDADKKPLASIASNAGHLLFSRIPVPQRAAVLSERLLRDDLWSGWGIRTLSTQHPSYNPLSYHNGSVWPHDNAIIALGLSYYGFGERAEEIFHALFEVSSHFQERRLPELFSGLQRGDYDFPAHYPVACNPQAWASGSWFMFLQAMLGLMPDASAGLLRVRSPRLPRWLRELRLDNIRIGKSRVSLRFVRIERRCFVDVVSIEGAPLRVQIEL